MSRVGKNPIVIPAGLEIKIEGNVITVQGPKGLMVKEFHEDMKVVVEEGQMIVTRPSDNKSHRSLHGMTRTILANMVEGVTKGFEKSLALEGVGYRAAKQGQNLVLTVGYSHPVEIKPEAGLDIEVPAVNKIIVKGIDKEKVGQLAANIRSVRPPEPYKGKGIRYSDELVRIKAGKTGMKAD